MIAIVDYGVGNIFSLCCSLKYIGADAVLTSDADVIRKADRVLLPGVGAFGDARQKLEEMFGDKVDIFRPAPRILDIHARGVSKIKAARNLQHRLGRKILVCVGDAENDIPMLDGADFAYVPADAALADRYETVCPCGEGAVADVIYKKIPEILRIQP